MEPAADLPVSSLFSSTRSEGQGEVWASVAEFARRIRNRFSQPQRGELGGGRSLLERHAARWELPAHLEHGFEVFSGHGFEDWARSYDRREGYDASGFGDLGPFVTPVDPDARATGFAASELDQATRSPSRMSPPTLARKFRTRPDGQTTRPDGQTTRRALPQERWRQTKSGHLSAYPAVMGNVAPIAPQLLRFPDARAVATSPRIDERAAPTRVIVDARPGVVWGRARPALEGRTAAERLLHRLETGLLSVTPRRTADGGSQGVSGGLDQRGGESKETLRLSRSRPNERLGERLIEQADRTEQRLLFERPERAAAEVYDDAGFLADRALLQPAASRTAASMADETRTPASLADGPPAAVRAPGRPGSLGRNGRLDRAPSAPWWSSAGQAPPVREALVSGPDRSNAPRPWWSGGERGFSLATLSRETRILAGGDPRGLAGGALRTVAVPGRPSASRSPAVIPSQARPGMAAQRTTVLIPGRRAVIQASTTGALGQVIPPVVPLRLAGPRLGPSLRPGGPGTPNQARLFGSSPERTLVSHARGPVSHVWSADAPDRGLVSRDRAPVSHVRPARAPDHPPASASAAQRLPGAEDPRTIPGRQTLAARSTRSSSLETAASQRIAPLNRASSGLSWLTESAAALVVLPRRFEVAQTAPLDSLGDASGAAHRVSSPRAAILPPLVGRRVAAPASTPHESLRGSAPRPAQIPLSQASVGPSSTSARLAASLVSNVALTPVAPRRLQAQARDPLGEPNGTLATRSQAPASTRLASAPTRQAPASTRLASAQMNLRFADRVPSWAAPTGALVARSSPTSQTLVRLGQDLHPVSTPLEAAASVSRARALDRVTARRPLVSAMPVQEALTPSALGLRGQPTGPQRQRLSGRPPLQAPTSPGRLSPVAWDPRQREVELSLVRPGGLRFDGQEFGDAGPSSNWAEPFLATAITTARRISAADTAIRPWSTLPSSRPSRPVVGRLGAAAAPTRTLLTPWEMTGWEMTGPASAPSERFATRLERQSSAGASSANLDRAVVIFERATAASSPGFTDTAASPSFSDSAASARFTTSRRSVRAPGLHERGLAAVHVSRPTPAVSGAETSTFGAQSAALGAQSAALVAPTAAARPLQSASRGATLFGDRGPRVTFNRAEVPGHRVMVETSGRRAAEVAQRSTPGERPERQAETNEEARHRQASDQIDGSLSPEDVDEIAREVVVLLKRELELDADRIGQDEWD